MTITAASPASSATRVGRTERGSLAGVNAHVLSLIEAEHLLRPERKPQRVADARKLVQAECDGNEGKEPRRAGGLQPGLVYRPPDVALIAVLIEVKFDCCLGGCLLRLVFLVAVRCVGEAKRGSILFNQSAEDPIFGNQILYFSSSADLRADIPGKCLAE